MKIEQVIIKQIYINNKDKAGKEFISQKTGKPFQKIALKTAEYSNEYLTNFIFNPDDPQLTWKIGDKVSVIVEKNGQYMNYHLPKRIDYLEQRIESLEKSVSMYFGGRKSENKEVEGEIKIADLPY